MYSHPIPPAGYIAGTGVAAEQSQCAEQPPRETTAGDVLDGQIAELVRKLTRLVILKLRTPDSVLHQPASDIRELAQQL